MAISNEFGAYSFGDVSVVIIGPNINQELTGIAEEGITLAYEGDAVTVVMGADGTGMVSQRVAQNGTVTIRVLKTSSINRILANAYYYQRGSTVNTAKNTLIVKDNARMDLVTCQRCSIQKLPDLTFATAPGMNEWRLTSLRIIQSLGDGITGVIGS